VVVTLTHQGADRRRIELYERNEHTQAALETIEPLQSEQSHAPEVAR
jgi:hypothetical protein